MSEKFTAAEIVEIGIQIEKNGYEFYTDLAKACKSETMQELFLYLAGEEESHITAFQEIHDSTQQYQPEELYPDDYFAYMKDLASEHVFSQVNAGKTAALEIQNDIEAIELALRFEHESIKFFEAMKSGVHEQEVVIIDKLIEQENRHIEKLNLLKSTYL